MKDVAIGILIFAGFVILAISICCGLTAGICWAFDIPFEWKYGVGVFCAIAILSFFTHRS